MPTPNNLPAPRAPIVGRVQELDSLQRIVLSEDVFLVTITGPGGIGKTRLALQLAVDLLDRFEDGVFFVALGPVTNPDLVLPTIAHTLAFSEMGSGDSGAPALQALGDALRDKKMLLIIDGFEQVIPAAPELFELVDSAQHLKLLVTSREALHLQGEHGFPLHPLPLPDIKKLPGLERLAQYDGVRLFIARSVAVKPDFAVTNQNAPAVAEICVRLDGLPLAIELAAARSKLLPPQAMLSRLESRLQLLTGGAQDLPVRQQTLRDAIAWSYDLLSPDEQALFRRISVFVGGCTLEAAEAILDFRFLILEPVSIQNQKSKIQNPLDGLDSFVRKSLLRQEEQEGGQPRFTMLETIREFGLEQLAASNEDEAARRAHMDYFLALAEEAEPHLRGPGQVEWLDKLEAEHDNLRAALRFSLHTHPKFEAGLRMAGALERFWQMRGYVAEGLDWLAEVLALPEAFGPTAARAKALATAGRLAFQQYDYEASEYFLQESLAMQRALRDEEGIAQSLAGLGSVAQRQEEYAVARSLYEESLAISRELRDTFGLAASLGNLGMAALREGNHEQAASFLEESLNLFRELGAKDRIALTLDGLGRVALAQGDYGRALPLFQESLELLTRVNYKWACANCLVELALLAVAQGQPERATRLLGAADSLFVLVGVRLDSAQQEAYDRCIAEARAKMGSPDFEAAWSDGQSTDLQEATRFALSEPTQGKQTAQVSQRAVPDLRMTTSVEKAPQPAGSESAYIEDLTDRERQVLGLVATGKSNPQIANELYLSINTVQAHLRSIFSKLGVASRIEAVRYAYQHAP